MFNRNKSYKDIEASRNVRLWITEVIIPAGMMGVCILSNENAMRELKKFGFKMRTKGAEVKQTLKNIFSKEEKEES